MCKPNGRQGSGSVEVSSGNVIQCGHWGLSVPNEVVEVLEAPRRFNPLFAPRNKPCGTVVYVDFRDLSAQKSKSHRSSPKLWNTVRNVA